MMSNHTETYSRKTYAANEVNQNNPLSMAAVEWLATILLNRKILGIMGN